MVDFFRESNIPDEQYIFYPNLFYAEYLNSKLFS